MRRFTISAYKDFVAFIGLFPMRGLVYWSWVDQGNGTFHFWCGFLSDDMNAVVVCAPQPAKPESFEKDFPAAIETSGTITMAAPADMTL